MKPKLLWYQNLEKTAHKKKKNKPQNTPINNKQKTDQYLSLTQMQILNKVLEIKFKSV